MSIALRIQVYFIYFVWGLLGLTGLVALFYQRWSMAFVALVTMGLAMLPAALAARLEIRLPVAFLVFTTGFVVATLFLGEALNFYEKYWWWDIALHSSSAMGFGLIGFLLMFYLFHGDRYAAPPWAVAFFGWCFAVAIGAIWEIFEFGMDQIFGLNMQKSGLVDTMSDLIVDVLGAILGAVSGFLYLKGQERGGLFAWMIADFVKLNKRLFRKIDRRQPRG